jgi:hypothetical protein
VLEPEGRAGKGGGLFGRAGRKVRLDGRGEEEGDGVGIGAIQNSGERDEEERARERQRTGKGAVVKDSEVVYHLHSLPLCLYCRLLSFSASVVVDTHIRAGTP